MSLIGFDLIYILDKFRLKFRELLYSCCHCDKSIEHMKLSTSTMIPYKTSITVQYQSPISIANNNHRLSLLNQTRQTPINSFSLSTESGQALLNNTQNQSFTCRLTNV